MLALAHRFDSTAGIVRRAPAGLDAGQQRWLEGQRTGAWTRLGDFDRARAALADCTSFDWWCAALRGYVAHRQGRFVEAEEEFRDALATMPPGRACYWNDVSLLQHSTALSSRHGGAETCPSLMELEDFWALADPLFIVPGNDRMTEHYARHVELAIHEDFLALFDGSHTPSHHSTIMRLGWPTGFRVLPLLRDAALRTELTWSGGLGLVPPAHPDSALALPADVFAPRPDDLREQYRPTLGHVEAVPVQYGFTMRDGKPGLLVKGPTGNVTTAGPSPDRGNAGGAGAPEEWHLRSWDGAAWRDGSATVAAGSVTGWLPTPWVAQVFSLESLTPTGALRGRSGTRPPFSSGSATVSSVLLLDGGAAGDSHDAAAVAMLPGTVVRAGADVAAWWEVYGAAGRRAAVQLTTRRLDRPGLLARLLRRDTAPVRSVRWEEALDPERTATPRRVSLDVTGLPAGDYELRLDITLDDGTRLNADARFRVVR
ncbi:MAG TPA: hypothetical protein VK929_01195 [Longimicrobiales bacterium]|nr:hypothetical protein [Longimicrobiales bacterium]